MPWPKGQKRKGYVRKDGQAHGKWGQSLSPQVAVRIQELRSRMSSTDTGIRDVTTETEGSSRHTQRQSAKNSSTIPSVRAGIRSLRRRYSTPLAHPQYSIEQCPNCQFPEADGGYCPDCGWSVPVVYGVAF